MADIQLNKLDLQRLGTVRYDGSIQLEDLNRKYKRIRQSARDVLYLDQLGFVETMSSNVSAIMRDGEDLLIRFHNDSVYRYFGQGYHFDSMLKSSSKGNYVWVHFRWKQIPFLQEQSIVLPSGVQHSNLTYEEIGQRFADDYQRFNIPIQDSSEDITRTLINLFNKQSNINLSGLDLISLFNLI